MELFAEIKNEAKVVHKKMFDKGIKVEVKEWWDRFNDSKVILNDGANNSTKALKSIDKPQMTYSDVYKNMSVDQLKAAHDRIQSDRGGLDPFRSSLLNGIQNEYFERKRTEIITKRIEKIYKKKIEKEQEPEEGPFV